MSDHEKISELARKYYEEEGRPEGKADEHWACAEKALREERQTGFPEEPERPPEAAGEGFR